MTCTLGNIQGEGCVVKAQDGMTCTLGNIQGDGCVESAQSTADTPASMASPPSTSESAVFDVSLCIFPSAFRHSQQTAKTSLLVPTVSGG